MIYTKTGIVGFCPECETAICFNKRPRQGQLIICHSCEETLQVTAVAPVQLTWAFEAPWIEEDVG